MKISNVRRGFSALATAVAAAAATFLIASPALSDWWVTYDVTGALRTLTPLEVQIDSLVKTNVLAGWSDGTSTTNTSETATFAVYNGASVTPGLVTYPAGEFPALNQNQIQLHFFEDSGEGAGIAGIQDGDVQVGFYDYYMELLTVDPGNPLVQLLSGLNDTRVSGGLGTLVGSEVTNWTSDPRGVLHNELFCKGGGLPICGTLGLPPNDTISIIHNKQFQGIDRAGEHVGTDDAGDPTMLINDSIGMTFSNNFQDVYFEVTFQPGDGVTTHRQYQVLNGTLANARWAPSIPTPTLSDWQLVFLGLGLLAVAIPVLMRARTQTAA